MKRSSARLLLPLITLAAIVALYLPWGWHPNASLSPNVHDLAEWISLSPQAQAQNPPLLGSLLLRGSVAMLAILSGMQIARPSRRQSVGLTALGLAIAVGLAFTLLPPLDFLSDPGNLNYRQQFLAAIVALVGIFGLIVVSGRLPARIWNGLGLLIALGAGLMGVLGLVLAGELFATLGVSLTVGGGAAGFVGLQCVQAGIYGREFRHPHAPPEKHQSGSITASRPDGSSKIS